MKLKSFSLQTSAIENRLQLLSDASHYTAVMLAHHPSLTKLRVRWCLVTALSFLLLSLGYVFVRSAWYPGHAHKWLVWSVLVMAIQLGILWWGLQHNHRRHEDKLLPTFGYGNRLTLLRGVMIGMLAGFLFAPRPLNALAWAPALLYTSACVLDYLDGYIARITNHATVLGEILDIEFDGLGLLIAVTLAIQYGQIPLWYLILGLGRQLFIVGIWARRRLDLPVYELPPSDNRRVIAGFQMGFVSVMLWPVFSPPMTTLACVLFSIPLAGSFGRDWLVVSGWLDAESPAYVRGRRLVKLTLERWLPLMLRILGAVVMLVLLWMRYPTFAAWQTYLQQAAPALLVWVLQACAVLTPVALVLFAVGALGRIGALILTGVVCLDILATGFQWSTHGLLLVSTLWVLQMGSGALSIWRSEEHFLHRRAGERQQTIS